MRIGCSNCVTVHFQLKNGHNFETLKKIVLTNDFLKSSQSWQPIPVTYCLKLLVHYTSTVTVMSSDPMLGLLTWNEVVDFYSKAASIVGFLQ